METIGKILMILVFGYLGWAGYESWRKGRLTIPLLSHEEEDLQPQTPDQLAANFHHLFMDNRGFKAVVHPDTINERDILIGKAAALDNDSLKALYAAYNKRYSSEGKGTFTRIINDAAGDPFDKFNTKSNLVKKLRALNCN